MSTAPKSQKYTDEWEKRNGDTAAALRFLARVISKGVMPQPFPLEKPMAPT